MPTYQVTLTIADGRQSAPAIVRAEDEEEAIRIVTDDLYPDGALVSANVFQISAK